MLIGNKSTDQAADWLIVNDTKQHNFSTTSKENKQVGGM